MLSLWPWKRPISIKESIFSIHEVTVGHLMSLDSQVPKRRCTLPMSVWAVAWRMKFLKMCLLVNEQFAMGKSSFWIGKSSNWMGHGFHSSATNHKVGPGFEVGFASGNGWKLQFPRLHVSHVRLGEDDNQRFGTPQGRECGVYCIGIWVRSGGDGTKGSGTCGSWLPVPAFTKKSPRQHHISTSTSQATSARWPPAPPGSAAPPSQWSRPCGRRSDDGNDG